jgi:hypothetical protein
VAIGIRRQIPVKESKEVKELRSRILGMELELDILSKDLERFKCELYYNRKMLKSTNENLDFLKNTEVAVSLTEYKKIKQQKELLEMRISYYIGKIQPLEQIVGRKEGDIQEDMKRFEKIYREQFRNNVLEFPHDRRKKA